MNAPCSITLALSPSIRPLGPKAEFAGVLRLIGTETPEPAPDEPILPFFSHASAGEEKADAAHLWDEKTGLREAEPSTVLATKPYSLSERLNKNGFALVLDYFSPWGRSGLVSPPCEKPPVLLKEAVPTQPKLTLVNSEAAAIASPMAKANPLTVEYLQALRADLPGMVEVLDRVRDVTGAAPYQLELMRLGNLISKAVKPERPEDAESALCFSGFSPAQVDSLRERVNALSTHSLSMTQSSQRFFRLPDLSDIKKLHAGLVGTGYFIGALAVCSMGVSVPTLILASASLSLAGLIIFSVYDRFKASEEAEGNEDINKIADFTKRFKNLKDAAIMFSFAAQDRRIQTQEKQIEVINTVMNTNQQSQAQKIAELEAKNQRLEEALSVLITKVEAMEHKEGNTVEGQPTAAPNPPVKQKDKLTIA